MTISSILFTFAVLKWFFLVKWVYFKYWWTLHQHQPFYEILALTKEMSTHSKYHCCLVWSCHMMEVSKFGVVEEQVMIKIMTWSCDLKCAWLDTHFFSRGEEKIYTKRISSFRHWNWLQNIIFYDSLKWRESVLYPQFIIMIISYFIIKLLIKRKNENHTWQNRKWDSGSEVLILQLYVIF